MRVQGVADSDVSKPARKKEKIHPGAFCEWGSGVEEELFKREKIRLIQIMLTPNDPSLRLILRSSNI
ncbi:hypothetical protein Tco_0323178 [Tanacetum coccineum]